MLVSYSLCHAFAIGALLSCARAVDDRGGAPLDNTELHLNQPITIVGEVNEVRGEQALTLIASPPATDERLLVIAVRPMRQLTMGNATIFRGEWLRIRGTVRRLDVAAVERAYGIDLDPDLEVIYRDRPVIVTDWISEP